MSGELRARPEPCEFCPYRRDVPSGVWSAEEYHKLACYDLETAYQPILWFGCHAQPNFACHGWAATHGRQEGEYDLLARRMTPFEPPEHDPLLLFESGYQAARHGLARIKHPGKRALAAVARLMQYRRIRENPNNETLRSSDAT